MVNFIINLISRPYHKFEKKKHFLNSKNTLKLFVFESAKTMLFFFFLGTRLTSSLLDNMLCTSLLCNHY